MKIDVRLTREPLRCGGEPPADGRCGAWVEFAGVVRSEENGAPLAALGYEAYEAMAVREMERILRDLAQEHPCECVEVIHRIGRVGAGEASILVRVASVRRAAAFAMLAGFMDRLKKDVPVWKKVAE